MTVGRRLLWSQLTLVACAALLGGAALAGLAGLRHHYLAAEEHYEDLRSLYEIGHRAAMIRVLMSDGAPDRRVTRNHLLLAAREAQKLRGDADGDARPHSLAIQNAGAAIQHQLRDFAQHLDMDTASPALLAGMNRTLGRIASLAGTTEREISANRRAATAKFQSVLVAMAVLLAITITIAATVGTMQYRSVVRPLRALDAAVNRLAGVRFGGALPEQGDREFRHLMRHFNRMSRTLEHLHASMAQQVEVKSRQLVRSERLAGVGYLAAGLAHEINNPLGIIAGYAETSLRRLKAAQNGSRDEVIGTVEQTLGIICEEAFRCRDITRDLLQMAQPLDGDTEVMHIAPLVERAIRLVRGLPVARDREIVLCADEPAGEPVCRGHASQLLQVLINLLTNALEACPAGRGSVLVSYRRELDGTIITVTDNGCGMSEEVLRCAFDPFFTDKPRRGLTGCGLGLSVSHAIIERHGGRLYAHSDGPECGSSFTIELPVAPAAEPVESERACLTSD